MGFFEKEYYTSDEVAKLLGVTKRSIRNYIKEGKITGTKYGGRWNFTKEDIEDYIKNVNSKLLPDEKERRNYSIFKNIYFMDSEEEIQEKIDLLVDLFNKYIEESNDLEVRMLCEMKGDLKLEFTITGPSSSIHSFMIYLM